MMQAVQRFAVGFAACWVTAGALTVSSLPPLAASGDVTKGKLVYTANCLTCHGERGKGDGLMAEVLPQPLPDLTSPTIQAKSDQELLTVIRNGRGAMPMWEGRLGEQDIQNVLAYIRSLNG